MLIKVRLDDFCAASLVTYKFLEIQYTNNPKACEEYGLKYYKVKSANDVLFHINGFSRNAWYPKYCIWSRNKQDRNSTVQIVVVLENGWDICHIYLLSIAKEQSLRETNSGDSEVLFTYSSQHILVSFKLLMKYLVLLIKVIYNTWNNKFTSLLNRYS